MAVLVVLYMDDDADTSWTDLHHNARTIGVYDFPKLADVGHTCTGTMHGGWLRNEDGYIVCVCGGRHPEWRKRFLGALRDYLGYNLLPRAKTPRIFQNPEGVPDIEG
jgi:hypothetical protein